MALLTAFLPLALAAGPPARLSIGAGAAAYSSGYHYHQGAQYELFLGAGASASIHPVAPGAPGGAFVVQCGFVALAPLRADGAAGGVASAVRVGYESPTLTLVVGMQARADATPAPVTALPSLLVAWRPGPVGVSLALLEHPLGPLARVGIDTRYAGISYAAPLGAEAYVRLPLGGTRFDLEARAFGYELLGTGHIGATMSLVFRAGGGP